MRYYYSLTTLTDEVYATPYLWQKHTLRISFTNEFEDPLKREVFRIACKWLEHANLNFELADNDDDTADIKINTDNPKASALSYTKGNPTHIESASLMLGVRPTSALDMEFEGIILREFGYILGMSLEIHHPQAKIPWNFEYIRTKINNKFRDQFESQEAFESKLEQTFISAFTPPPMELRGHAIPLPYDVNSIMHLKVESDMTLDGWQSETNLVLSEKDKQFMRTAYPGRG